MNKVAFFQFFQMHPLFKSESLWFSSVACRGSEFFHDDKEVADLLQKERWPFYLFWLEKADLYKRLQQDLWQQFHKGYRWIARGDRDFPAQLYLLDDPPWILSYFGNIDVFKKPLISVVGSREIADVSEAWMQKELWCFLKEQKATIVSGGARGVDQWAHMLSLRAGLSTVVVVPSGLGVLYPKSLMHLQEEVVQSGGVFISEFGFNCVMQKSFFSHRNRLIAASGVVSLVVQAKERSGTLITANRAAHLGKPVWVVPGHPLDVRFGGSMELISEGATLVRDAQEMGAYWQQECVGLSFGNPSIVSDSQGRH